MPPCGLLGNQRPVPTIDGRAFDADAGRYIDAVEAADGQRLETQVAAAVNAFVLGCKADNIWDSLLDCCLLCGARTLAGALVPIKGLAPVNYNVVSADYARGGATPGIKGNASTKRLDSQRAMNSLSPTNCHLSVFVTDIGTLGSTAQYIGTTTLALLYAGNRKIRARVAVSVNDSVNDLRAVGFIGGSRSGPSTHFVRGNKINETITANAGAFTSTTLAVMARTQDGNFAPTFDIPSDGRIAAYTTGTAVNLMALEFRLSQYIRDLGQVLP